MLLPEQETAMTTLSIPDMTCGHCKASVVAVLTPLADDVTVDLAARTVAVTPKAPTDALIAALARIGFPASVMAA
jgi:copper chaperone